MSNKERNRIPEEKTLREHFKNLRMPLEVWLALTHTHTHTPAHSLAHPILLRILSGTVNQQTLTKCFFFAAVYYPLFKEKNENRAGWRTEQ